LWGKRVARKTKNMCKTIIKRLYYMVQKSGIFKKKIKKLTVKVDFWRRSVKVSRKGKIPNLVIRKEMSSQNSVLNNIKTKQKKRVWTCPKNARQQMACLWTSGVDATRKEEE
jgi:hypothetical protein